MKKKARTIDIALTWEGILPMLLVVLSGGTTAGCDSAEKELKRMAKLADRYSNMVDMSKRG